LAKNCDKPSSLPDVILLDLNMPILDGWQFLDEFVKLPIKKEIAIFIVTSSIDPSDIEMVKKYDIVKSYIMKPITAQKLEEATLLIG
jgi:CheY-like chemotaxis protein